MNALSMTILLGVLVMLIVVVAFLFTVKSGQYDDLDGPAFRILMDDDDPRIPGNSPKVLSEEEKNEKDLVNKKTSPDGFIDYDNNTEKIIK